MPIQRKDKIIFLKKNHVSDNYIYMYIIDKINRW